MTERCHRNCLDLTTVSQAQGKYTEDGMATPFCMQPRSAWSLACNTGQNTTHSCNCWEEPIFCRNNTWYGQSQSSVLLMGLTRGAPLYVSSSHDSAGLDRESRRNPKLSPHKREPLLTGLEKSLKLAGFALTSQPRLCVCCLFMVSRFLSLFIATDAFSGSFSQTSVFSPLFGQRLQTFLSGVDLSNDVQAVATSREGHCNISGRGGRYTLH